jgi:hypothetical protein
MIPNGKYLARATGSALGFAGTGTPQVAVSFEVELPDNGTADLTWFGSFTENSEAITMKSLRVLGFDGENELLTVLAPEDPTKSPIVGARCKVTIESETGQDGQVRPRIKWVNPETSLQMKNPIEGQQLNAFAAQVLQRAKARRAASGRPPSPVGQRPASPAPGSNAGKPTPAALGDFDPPF